MISDISGVRKRGTGWICRWQEDGAGRSFTSQDKGAVEAKRQELLRHQGGPGPALDLPAPDLTTSEGWMSAIQTLGVALHSAAVGGDSPRLGVLRRYQIALVELGKLWTQGERHRKTERLLEELVERMEQVGHRDAVEHATQQHGVPGIAHTLQRANADGPDDPLERGN